MTDTIAAIATPPGTGGIGIVRVSGSQSLAVLQRMFRPAAASFKEFRPFVMHHGRVVNAQGHMLDDVLAVFMPGPHTFTGEDVAEVHCHGGMALLSMVLEEVLQHHAPSMLQTASVTEALQIDSVKESCPSDLFNRQNPTLPQVRLAEKGEFTRRAFVNGRMDLAQAEAVAEMIAAPSRQGARLAAGRLEGLLGQRVQTLRDQLEMVRAQLCLAVDFPEEEVECLSPETFLKALHQVHQGVRELLEAFERTRCWREGVLVALAGPVNAGKSSLMNALLGHERAIVSDSPGTTRDFIEEALLFDGLPARLVDTAGLRRMCAGSPHVDPVEAQGIRLGRDRVEAAQVVMVLVDGLTGLTAETLELVSHLDPKRTVLVWNKVDLAPVPDVTTPMGQLWNATPGAAHVALSARTGQGLEQLARTVRMVALGADSGDPEPGEAVPNLRQAQSLGKAAQELEALASDVHSGVPYDLCAVRLEIAAMAMGEVIGLDTPDDVLNRIFDSFCIGK